MNTPDNLELRRHIFGYPCHLVIGNEDRNAEQMLEIATDELARLESRFSSFEPESLIGAINRQAGDGSFIPLDDEARSLFTYVTTLWESTEHRFDPTVSLLQECYEDERTAGKTAACVRSRLARVGWNMVEVSPRGARLKMAGMFIDLNGSVRPYAVDRVRKLLERAGVGSALIDLDRDIATIGKQSDGANWMYGMRYPRGSRAAIARGKLNDGSIAIRGDFERCLVYNEDRYGRALDPASGQPIPGLLSVAVTAQTCVEACSAATVARMKNETDALSWLAQLDRPWLAIDRQLRCHGPLTPNPGR